jgi:hypothetical protein
MTTKTSRIFAELIVTAAMVSVLAACTPDPQPTAITSSSPSASPSQTSFAVPAPEDESEAIDFAERTIDRFLEVRGEVNAAGGTDTDELGQVATGPALRIALDDAARVVELGWKSEGALTFEPATAYAVDLVAEDGTSYPFSSVNVTGCQDGTNYTGTNPDGTPIQRPANLRAEIEFNVIWDPNLTLWLVNSIIATGATC